MPTTLVTAAIPYVNAAPHLGYAYELVQADVAARALRATGHAVRLTTGTDDNSLKNVLAAEAVGEDAAAFVDRHANRFAALEAPLGLALDDFVRTSRDERHRAAVERIWTAAEAAGDLYRRDYVGDYCVGCEQFWRPDELVDGRCPEHLSPTERVEELNWFFRLSRYRDRLHRLISDDAIEIRPEPFRREALAFVERGLDDLSVSRSAERARGWGLPVPGDPSQVVYVWFDALTNYLSALDWGGAGPGAWRALDERIHVIGKGILRFHAIYWPAFLASAGEPPPTRIRVHPYLTVDGRKLSKSAGASIDPTSVVEATSTDALRWAFARDVGDVADTDVSIDRIVERADDELANGIANAAHRITTLVARHLDGVVAPGPVDEVIDERCAAATAALAAIELRDGSRALAEAIDRLNATISATEPWVIARDPDRRDELAAVLGSHLAGVRRIATTLAPICPGLSARLLHLTAGSPLPTPTPALARLRRRPPAAGRRAPGPGIVT
ncbi:MAG: methionine--tRNA ligase [Actinomycetota bacterium]